MRSKPGHMPGLSAWGIKWKTSKREILSGAGSDVTRVLATWMQRQDSEVESIIRSVMKPEQLLLWDLSRYWEKESINCAAVGAHFSAMVSAVAMNEAFLCYLCLAFKKQLRETELFKRNSKGREDASMTELIGGWSLKTLLQFASSLNWIPNNLIDSQIVRMMQEVLVEMRNDRFLLILFSQAKSLKRN